jgi:hypothetical protein
MKCSFKTLNEQKVRRQALLRETLGLFGARAASRSQTLALFGLFQTATCANNPLHLPYAHDDITSLLVTSLGHLGPTFHCKWVNPPRSGSTKVPLMERPLLLRCKSSIKHCPVSAPLTGLSNHLMGSSAPWRSELIISPCVPVQMVPVRQAWSCTSKTSPSMGSLVTGIIAMLITFHH